MRFWHQPIDNQTWTLPGRDPGGLDQRNQRLGVTAQGLEGLALEIESVAAEGRRVAQASQRFEHVMGHSEFEIALGLGLNLPQTNSTSHCHRSSAPETVPRSTSKAKYRRPGARKDSAYVSF